MGQAKDAAILECILVNVANVGMLPVPMLPVAISTASSSITIPRSLVIGIGNWQHLHTGNIGPSSHRHKRLPCGRGDLLPLQTSDSLGYKLRCVPMASLTLRLFPGGAEH